MTFNTNRELKPCLRLFNLASLAMIGKSTTISKTTSKIINTNTTTTTTSASMTSASEETSASTISIILRFVCKSVHICVNFNFSLSESCLQKLGRVINGVRLEGSQLT